MIYKAITQSMKDKLPFVAYRKPNSNLLNGLFQKFPEIHYSNDYSESGFIFAPFDAHNQSVLIPMHGSNFMQEELELESKQQLEPVFVQTTDNVSKVAHMQLVEKAIEAIDQDQFQKVVISREEVVSLKRFKCLKVFRRLL
ncbi:MAG: isochorismate synthase, partial [Flavobacteriaceae bacterium]|nr:isochorismate synthase [Flavobacteriaceae bacterium]